MNLRPGSRLCPKDQPQRTRNQRRAGGIRSPSICGRAAAGAPHTAALLAPVHGPDARPMLEAESSHQTSALMFCRNAVQRFK